MFNDVENSYCKADLENLCSWDFKEGEMESTFFWRGIHGMMNSSHVYKFQC